MRRCKVISYLKPFLPVIIGLSLGFSMSIVRIPISHENCIHVSKDHGDRKLNSLHRSKDIKFVPEENAHFQPMSDEEAIRYRKDREYVPPVYDTLEDFEPHIITDPELKPKIDFDPEASKKKIVRTRYISTELGIREKLICAVLTTADSFKTLGLAVNKTFTHHMQKVLFFHGLGQNLDENSLDAQYMTLILHPSSNPTQILYETINYLYSKFKDEYDWYYVVPDGTYSEGDRVNYLVDHMSINRRLYMGKPLSYQDRMGTVTYCSVNSGFIISRLLLLDLMGNIKVCLDDTDMKDLPPDKWLGRCIMRITRGAVECVEQEEGIFFQTFDLESAGNFDPETESAANFKDSVTVTGVETPQMMYTLHKRFSQIEIDKAYNEIVELQDEIRQLAPKLPEGEQELSWPIGINPPFKPTNRWDIIVWDYFTEDYTLTCPGEVPKCELSGVDKVDIQNILQIALDRLNEKYNDKGLIIEKKKLVNGYRRFDPQRGMEYMLDLLLNVMVKGATEQVEVSHRVNMLRPLSQVEIIPMPYVTETAKVNIILPLTSQDRAQFVSFMDRYAKVCLNNDENVGLNIVFIYNPDDAQRIHENDIFAKQKQLLQEYEGLYKKASSSSPKLIPWVSIKTEVPSQLKIMDIVAKKYPNEALFFLTSVAANINLNFLNRCRMNTIPGWQTFFPIPFSSYNPEIIYKDVPAPEQIEIKPNNGHFDIYSFDEVCVYNADYMAARTKLSASVATQKTTGTIAEHVDSLDIYDMMIKYSQMHIFRAVEPMLTRRYIHRNCNALNGEEIFQRCERSNAEGLASRTQLAMELFPDNT
ncbi:chondroitin sulfate glucuronyltransferase-like [Clavelina lepadiformis]|uniref:chondroitin sulfate glucuronyltransferase-like n=1 Tax=Clavelina lepadiformis TaxID=159417 RepID=UPI004042523A